jgi:hypothetical protein
MRAALWGWGLAAAAAAAARADGARAQEWLSEGPPELGLLLSLPPGARDARRAHVECSPADVATDDGRAEWPLQGLNSKVVFRDDDEWGCGPRGSAQPAAEAFGANSSQLVRGRVVLFQLAMADEDLALGNAPWSSWCSLSMLMVNAAAAGAAGVVFALGAPPMELAGKWGGGLGATFQLPVQLAMYGDGLAPAVPSCSISVAALPLFRDRAERVGPGGVGGRAAPLVVGGALVRSGLSIRGDVGAFGAGVGLYVDGVLTSFAEGLLRAVVDPGPVPVPVPGRPPAPSPAPLPPPPPKRVQSVARGHFSRAYRGVSLRVQAGPGGGLAMAALQDGFGTVPGLWRCSAKAFALGLVGPGPGAQGEQEWVPARAARADDANASALAQVVLGGTWFAKEAAAFSGTGVAPLWLPEGDWVCALEHVALPTLLQGRLVWGGSKPMGYFEAEKECAKTPGGHLASVHSAAQNKALAQSVPGGQSAWIGMQRSNGAIQMRWEDGSNVDYSNWLVDAEGPDEGEVKLRNCAALNPGRQDASGNAGAGWSLERCDDKRAFVCTSKAPRAPGDEGAEPATCASFLDGAPGAGAGVVVDPQPPRQIRLPPESRELCSDFAGDLDMLGCCSEAFVQAQVVPSAARAAAWAGNSSECRGALLDASCALCAANQGAFVRASAGQRNSTLRVCKHTCRRISASCWRSKNNLSEVQLCQEAMGLLAGAQLSNATGTTVDVQIVEDDGDNAQGSDGSCLGVDHVSPFPIEIWPWPGSLMSRSRTVNADGLEVLPPANHSHAPGAPRPMLLLVRFAETMRPAPHAPLLLRTEALNEMGVAVKAWTLGLRDVELASSSLPNDTLVIDLHRLEKELGECVFRGERIYSFKVRAGLLYDTSGNQFPGTGLGQVWAVNWRGDCRSTISDYKGVRIMAYALTFVAVCFLALGIYHRRRLARKAAAARQELEAQGFQSLDDNGTTSARVTTSAGQGGGDGGGGSSSSGGSGNNSSSSRSSSNRNGGAVGERGTFEPMIGGGLADEFYDDEDESYQGPRRGGGGEHELRAITRA